MKALKKTLIAAGAGAAILAMGASAAVAAPMFTFNPNAITGVSGYSPVVATDFTYFSDSLVQQTTPTMQTETGWAYITGFSNNGVGISAGASGVVSPQSFYPFPNAYGIYLQYTATANATSFASAGALTSFDFTMWADVGTNDTFTAGDANTGTAPVVGGVTAGDIKLAHGSIVFGGAGFQANGAPIFSAQDLFVVDDAAFFTQPVPFYNLVFTATTGASPGNVTVGAAGATINGITGAANFVPEPITLSVFGAGLLGAGALRRRKSKKA